MKAIELSELINALPNIETWQIPNTLITDITQDSRKVGVGSLFIAIQGEYFDGHRFITDAIERGALAVVGSQLIPSLPVPYIRVPDGRVALAQLAAAFYRYPSHDLTMIGVTGTDGKTTTSNLIYQILQSAGYRVGMISTVNALIGDQALDTGFHVTTPEALDVQRFLAQMREAGLTHVVLEATSHGLAQERVTACEFDLGVITNITHEHLDYHGSYEAYRAAKARLFSGLGLGTNKPIYPPQAAILNRDDTSFEYLSNLVTVPWLSYGVHAHADVRAENVHSTPNGLVFDVIGKDLQGDRFHFQVITNLAGEFNIANCLAAIAVGRGALRLSDVKVVDGIAALQGIPGRMESIDLGQDFTAIVDFAHTPNALRRALESARKLTDGHVIAVFGSAGLRDREKRRLMAEVSVELADLTVLTAEDPRTESLEEILFEMGTGARSRGAQEGSTFWCIRDRGEAISFALRQANAGDVVIACGKGHEQSMCFGVTEYPWDDRLAMRAALADFLKVPGPKMPYLPTQEDEP